MALTRHRDGVVLHYGRDEFGDASALARRLGRERLKDTSLDYPPEREAADLERRYAERRGLDPLHPVSEIVVRKSGREAVPEQAIAQGRAGFRERYAAHRQGVAAAERDGKARDLVASWDRLTEGYAKALPDLETDSLRFGVARAQLRQFGEGLRDQPELVRVLRERGAAFGLEERPDLARVLADAQPQRAIAGMMDAAEVQMRGQLREVAEQEAVRAREERAKRRSLDRGHGMGL